MYDPVSVARDASARDQNKRTNCKDNQLKAPTFDDESDNLLDTFVALSVCISAKSNSTGDQLWAIDPSVREGAVSTLASAFRGVQEPQPILCSKEQHRSPYSI